MVTIIKKGSTKAIIQQLLKKVEIKKGLDAFKYCGVIKLKTEKNA